jgi:hypothetical protein
MRMKFQWNGNDRKQTYQQEGWPDLKQNPEIPSTQTEIKEMAKNKNKKIASHLPPVFNLPTPPPPLPTAHLP